MFNRHVSPTLVILIILLLSGNIFPQDVAGERYAYKQILKTIRKDIEENYYDPKFHGIDLESTTNQSSGSIDRAHTVEEMNDIIARYLYQFDDSHLYFIPPRNTTTVDYGIETQMIGDKAFITDVKKGSDAWAKGIRPGDRLYMLEGFIPNREEFWRLKEHYEAISPQPNLTVIVTKLDGKSYKINFQAKVDQSSVFIPSRRDLILEDQDWYIKMSHQSFYDEIPGLCIWKMPSFYASEVKLDKMIDRIKKCPSLIFDLRGNGGGYISGVEQLVANFVDHDVTVGKLVKRKKPGTLSVRSVGKKAYAGKLIVLVDNASASATELFTRIIQLEKRGTIVGDRTAGSVMGAVVFPHELRLESDVHYAISVTEEDIIMSDGGRLEKEGVQPDVEVTPSGPDLFYSRDPALSRAAAILGFSITPEAAGHIFPKNSEDK